MQDNLLTYQKWSFYVSLRYSFFSPSYSELYNAYAATDFDYLLLTWGALFGNMSGEMFH